MVVNEEANADGEWYQSSGRTREHLTDVEDHLEGNSQENDSNPQEGKNDGKRRETG